MVNKKLKLSTTLYRLGVANYENRNIYGLKCQEAEVIR